MTTGYIDRDELPLDWDEDSIELDDLDDHNWELFDPDNADETDPTLVAVDADE